MNDIRIAISAPSTIPLEHLKKVKHELMSRYQIRYSHITYWDRHAFECANVVIVIADSKFGFVCKDLSHGVSEELTEAYYNSKPIFVAYENSNGQINFYSVDLQRGNGVMKVTGFSGIQGSSGKDGLFEKLLDNYTEVSFDGSKPVEYTAKQRLQNQQSDLAKSAHHLMQNSIYGTLGCSDSSYNTEQMKFPKVTRVYANTILNPDYVDNRLLLML